MDKQVTSPWAILETGYLKYPARPLVTHNQIQLTYRQVYQQARDLSESIKQFDNKIYGIYLPNSIEFLTFLFALNKESKIIVPLSYQLKGESLYERVKYADIGFIVTDESGYHELLRLKDRLDFGVILILKNGEYRIFEPKSKLNQNFNLPDDIFGICFTSGSTSRPKGVMISNQAISGNAAAVARFLKMEPLDIFMVTRSFAQAGPIAGDILMTISAGGSIIISNDLFHPAIFLKTIQTYQVTTTLLINTMLAMVVNYPQLLNYDLSSLQRIIFGGMVVSQNMAIIAVSKMPWVKFHCTYGMTETSTRISFSEPDDILKYPGSSGRTIKGCEVKIYREDGTEAAAHEVGEIHVTSDYVKKGYYKHEQLTRATLTPKGLRTGDIGYKDENGLLYVSGRSDDLIIQGGNNVFPIEIEEILLRNPQIKEAVILGIDDRILGQKIVALVSVTGGSALSTHDIYKWCRSNLEDRKMPKEIYILEQIPKTDLGKINRNELKKVVVNLNKERLAQ